MLPAALGMPEARVISLGEFSPQISEGVYLADGVSVAGDVIIGRDFSVWFNAVIRAEDSPVRIGERSNIQDGAILHSDPGFPYTVHDDVTIGYGAVVHGCTVGSGVTVGMGAVVLNGVTIGDRSIVAAGAVVAEGSDVAAGTLVAGVPARETRALDHSQRQRGRDSAERYVQKAGRYRAEMMVVERQGR
jgi:carbonic anhydrase/acetyltransferase-like protein (isoleucine patch superfamily)